MARVKRGVTAGRRHKKVLGKAKGYYNARRKVYRAAKQAARPLHRHRQHRGSGDEKWEPGDL